MNEESFVIRLYRKERLPAAMRRAEGGRRRHDETTLSGIVEIVERGERRAFHDIEGLWEILAGAVPEEPEKR